ncbi:MAG: Lrp/AsnC ligand binding domain-containing protein [Candidatus Bathyarchaeia archaeon]
MNADLNSATEVLGQLRACREVEEAFMVRGVYDIVATVKGETVNDLKKTIAEKIVKAAGVQKTLTMLVAETRTALS